MSFTCQSNLGPSFGHCLRRPLSCDIPSRCGPRHCGQSEVVAAMLAGFVMDTAEKSKQSAAMAVSNREVIAFSFCLLNYFAAPVFGGAAWRRVSICLRISATMASVAIFPFSRVARVGSPHDPVGE